MTYPEALHIVVFIRVDAVHVSDASIRDSSRQVGAEALNCRRSIVQVLGVTSHTPCVEVGFENFGPEDIVAPVICDVESMLCVEGKLVSVRWVAAGVTTV